ncbi:hypothetical protein BD414DRAFT_491236 [Trametes punicea]|nr:hypothetical protein BD414DRAFT_491236 [Trametes punicea]
MSPRPREVPASPPGNLAHKADASHLLSLNQDVLAQIISYLSYRDALSLSCTCKAAHAICLDPALHTVVLDRSSEQLLKFRDFLLATDLRPLFLRSLTVTKTVTWDLGDSAKEMASALADILKVAAKLQQFSCGAIRDLNRADTGIQLGLTALTQLVSLTLLEGGLETSVIVTTLKSPRLEQLTFDMLFHVDKLPFESFFGKLAQYHHLRSLSISRVYDRIVLPPALQTEIAIPSLRTLALHSTYLPMSLAAAVFPNVSRLTFTNARHYPNFSRTRIEPEEVASCWATLDEAHIDARDLIVWPITSRVRWLDLDVLRGGYSREAIAAVDRTGPRVLSCAYTIDADNLFWVRLPVIATDLRFLDVRLLELNGHPRRYMLMHLSRFPTLTALFLCIRAFYPPDNSEVNSIALDLAERNPQLQFIGISFTDGRTVREDEPVWDEERLGSTWFKVRRGEDGSNRELQDISTEAGLKVRDYMYDADYEAPDWTQRLSAME